VPKLARDDGVEIHWEARGEGPSVVLASYWSGHPGVYRKLLDDLSADHRTVIYDARGNGASTPRGPHDMETEAADLLAVVEAAGGPAVIIATADGCNRAVRIGAARPDLAAAVASLGVPPFALQTFEGTDSMLGSDTVVGAFLEMAQRDYRGALRTLLTVTNPQMTEDELRERVAFQAEYSPRDAAVGRLRAWMEDDPREAAREVAERLWIVTSRDVAEGWLPSFEKLQAITRETLPEARTEVLADGAISRPDLTAAVVRRLTGPLRETRPADAAAEPS
jgi:pimeloyl-ACP methyl ester carboxylesterase